MATANKKYKVIGTRPVRHDGVDKVTGRARYGADTKIQGMLYAAMLRSPHAHAKIKKLDTSKAAKLPGVRAVVTAADFPIRGIALRNSAREPSIWRISLGMCSLARRSSTRGTPSRRSRRTTFTSPKKQ